MEHDLVSIYVRKNILYRRILDIKTVRKPNLLLNLLITILSHISIIKRVTIEQRPARWLWYALIAPKFITVYCHTTTLKYIDKYCTQT